MKKLVYYCDICGQEDDTLESFLNVDICIYCKNAIIIKVIENKLLDLRPWCRACNGSGKEVSHDSDDIYDCEECTIR